MLGIFLYEGDYVGNHYLITAENAPSMTLVADEAINVLNVPVRAPYTATLNVTTTIGTGEPTLVTTNLVETDAKVRAWNYAYPLYAKSGDTYYKADNTTTFGEGGTFTDGEVINKSVTYSTAYEDIVYFYDQPTAGTNYAYSNGNTNYVAAQNARDRGIYVGTLAAGVYEYEVNITAANRRSLVVRQSTNDPLASVGTSNEDMTTGVKSAMFTLEAEMSNLYINGANSGEAKTNQSEDFDYALIKKAKVTTSISSVDYATFSSSYALDLDNISGGEAYVATSANGEYIHLEEATGVVPANTGLILKKVGSGEVTIPVSASAGTAPTTNYLVAVTADNTNVPEGNYVLAAEDGVAGFYVIGSTAATLDAGKAYLSSEISASAKSRLLFADDATGIKSIATETVENGVIYNLSGQRVNATYKGIVIKNGKKYLNK